MRRRPDYERLEADLVALRDTDERVRSAALRDLQSSWFGKPTTFTPRTDVATRRRIRMLADQSFEELHPIADSLRFAAGLRDADLLS